MNQEKPKVGVGVLLCHQGSILLGKRKNAHGSGSRSLPGGHLEYGESPVECATRELKEETGLTLVNPLIGPYTNDIFIEENKHYITLFILGEYLPSEQVQLLEPHKCDGREWFSREQLPSGLFLPFENLIKTGYTPF